MVVIRLSVVIVAGTVFLASIIASKNAFASGNLEKGSDIARQHCKLCYVGFGMNTYRGIGLTHHFRL